MFVALVFMPGNGISKAFSAASTKPILGKMKFAAQKTTLLTSSNYYQVFT